VDEMYIRVKGKWRYLYRSVDSSGATLDFLLWSQAGRGREQSASRAKALGRQNHPVPRAINIDVHAAYPPAVAELKARGALVEDCRHRPVPCLNNVLEQDHRAIPAAGQRQSAFPLLLEELDARRAGDEAIHMIRKGPFGLIMSALSAQSADIQITSLPFSITAPGSYVLTSNLTYTGGGPAITINLSASGPVVLDLKGYYVNGILHESA
jgi:IS6 family transposase